MGWMADRGAGVQGGGRWDVRWVQSLTPGDEVHSAKGGQRIGSGCVQHLGLYIFAHKKCDLRCAEQREGHADSNHAKHLGQRHPCSTGSKMIDSSTCSE